ncbi:MAG: helix-turn-helix transcriptional regulator [Spirochaetia bacterium]|nr:helix-turn-helix transcriptional regulator [Spirochaetia bacterium]
MEFNQKLQRYRKQNGLTQEQLAERLNISRTAVSKWESGRGFPNIEALKNISKVFQVPIDDLLSGEEILSIAEIDKTTGLNKVVSLVFGILDLLALAFIALPLYGQKEGDRIRAVNLLQYSEVSNLRTLYFVILISLAFLGAVEVIIHFFEAKKALNAARFASIIVHVLAILFFTLTREPYVSFFAILLFLAKILLIFRKSSRTPSIR